MGTHMGHVFTLANSIIGVSVLAMPFCFKQCGIVLSFLMLLLSNQMSRLACHYLMKSAIIERMKNFEMLAFRVFGRSGKLIVELSIIGFMLGTCVAFFVVIGDLGPNILGPILGLEHPTALRPSVLIATAVFVVLPLGLLRNVDSLNGICAVSLAFYGVLVLKVFFEASSNLFNTTSWSQVYYWRPSGLLRCVPIFSMALSCQTQLFEVFGSVPTTPLDRANAVVKSAVNLTTFLYISVGFFGYLANADTFLTGNVMMNFSDGASSEIIKICFLLSVAVSFPLVIFPCRASIYSFLYSKTQHSYDGFGSSHLPETRFQCITLVIVTSSLVIGLLIPNIELVLGLVGSTLGVFICVITPGVIFTTVSVKKNNERLLAQILVGAGVVIMVLGTYANLYATEETLTSQSHEVDEPSVNENRLELLPRHQDIEKDVALLESALKDLKREDVPVGFRSKAEPEKIQPDPVPPAKADEGPQPQPVAPQPPEEPVKKDPVVVPQPQPVAPEPPEEPVKKDPVVLPQPQPAAPEPPEATVKKDPVIIPQPQPVAPEPPEEPVKKDSVILPQPQPIAPELPKDPVKNAPAIMSQGLGPSKSSNDRLLKETKFSAELLRGAPSVIRKAVSTSGIIEKLAKKNAEPADAPEEPKAIEQELPVNLPAHNTSLAKSAVSSDIEKLSDWKLSPVIPSLDANNEIRIESAQHLEMNIEKRSQSEVADKVPAKADNMSASMAQGVPLPLAIKELEKAKIGRDILLKPEPVELREKRDLETVELADLVPSAGEGGEKQNVEGVAEFLKKTLVETDGDISISKLPNTAPREVAPNSLPVDSKPTENPPRKKIGPEEDEECPKTTSKTQDTESPLIKSPSKLTNEIPVLPAQETSFPRLKDQTLVVEETVAKHKK